jgi:hypothetical protein
MASYAVIKGDVVVNVIDAPSLQVAQEATGSECVECDGSFWIGWTRTNGEWIAPVKNEEDTATL